jgi:dUTP pyrophosphatase
MIELRVKKLHPDAIMPRYQTEGSACVDLHVVGLAAPIALEGGESMTFQTGIAFEVPRGYVMLVFSRSGHAFKNDVRLGNCVAVIDSDYRGEVKIRLRAESSGGLVVSNGDRIAQAMLVKLPEAELIEVDELSETERGTNGFGSTGSA